MRRTCGIILRLIMENSSLNLKAGLHLLQCQYINHHATEANNTRTVILGRLLAGI